MSGSDENRSKFIVNTKETKKENITASDLIEGGGFKNLLRNLPRAEGFDSVGDEGSKKN